jgi:hypothetical protein
VTGEPSLVSKRQVNVIAGGRPFIEECVRL